jgi:two-component system chemotaxis response regulator CheB
MKILLAEDDERSARAIAGSLRREGFRVTVAGDGKAALDHLRRQPVDVLVTDWMMPRMDGISLILRARETVHPVPYIIMITALNSEKARARALDSGADDFLTKPVATRTLLRSVKTGLSRSHQPAPVVSAGRVHTRLSPAPSPPFVGVVIAASTGGPSALTRLFKMLPSSTRAAFFIVQHAPAWMLESLASRLQQECRAKVVVASDGLRCSAGEVYLAPGDHHMTLSARDWALRLSGEPPVNFVRPAADPLFESAASALGSHCLGVILTGMGRDGTMGAGSVIEAGGIVLAQDPETAVAPSMPKTAIDAGVVSGVCPLDEMGGRIGRELEDLVTQLGVRGLAEDTGRRDR